MKYISILICIFIVGCTASADHGADHAISWTPSLNADGYQLYCGNETGSYSQNLNIGGGGASSVLLNTVGLTDGIWFCAMTSYNFAGASGFSNEINFAILGGSLLTQPPAAPTGLSFN
jgi:hypothetical protein